MNILIILTKYPTPGNVKTRLGKTIGMNKSAAVQRACLEKLISTHQHQSGYKVFVGLRPIEQAQYFSTEFGVSTDYIFSQQGSDLGATMDHALNWGLHQKISPEFSRQYMKEALYMGGKKKVILIGSDLPLITPKFVNNAFNELHTHDTVIGPSEDGGYYMIGATDSMPDVLCDMTYSTDIVFDETIHRCIDAQRSVSVLEKKHDCDEIDDLRHLVKTDTTGRWKKTCEEVDIQI